jgi:catechol 2,3-dioxygenase-like lactoylglutathione lyase family enzyme
MQKPHPTAGLRHVALYSKNFAESIAFYTDILQMKIIWQPDEDNVYMTTGDDNFALHRAKDGMDTTGAQRLDHFGFFLKTREEVDQWYDYLKAHQVDIRFAPKDHRDGTRSLYCADPDGNVIQLIYYPL